MLVNELIKETKKRVNIDNYIVFPRVEALFIFSEITEKCKDNILVLDSEYLYPFFPGEKTDGVTDKTFWNSWGTFSWSDKWYLKLCNKYWFKRLSLFIRKFTSDHEHF